MKTWIKRAGQAEIIRTTQKDLQYTNKINEDVVEIVQFLSQNNRQRDLIKFNTISAIVSKLMYHGFATMNRLQTLGEEYTGIIQIDSESETLPNKLLQLISILLEFGGDFLVLKLLKIYEKRINESDELLPEAKKFLLKLIITIEKALPYLKALHRGLFYLNSGHYQLSKRMTSINYVLIRFWLNEHHSTKGYKFLGVVTILQIILSLGSVLKTEYSQTKSLKLQQNVDIPRTYSNKKIEDPQQQSTKKCILCLEYRKDCTATQCGHLFCWTCICDWLQYKNECPVCREHLKSSSVIALQNYI